MHQVHDNWLTENRYNLEPVHGMRSNSAHLRFKVPQSSFLGPLLSLLYTQLLSSIKCYTLYNILASHVLQYIDITGFYNILTSHVIQYTGVTLFTIYWRHTFYNILTSLGFMSGQSEENYLMYWGEHFYFSQGWNATSFRATQTFLHSSPYHVQLPFHP